MVTVIQSVYGDYDDMTEPWHPQTVSVRLLYADTPRPHLHPRMAAKVAKCIPWRYCDDNTIIWVDGSIVPTDEHFIEHLLDWSGGPISQYQHPHRDCIETEARVSAGMLKYEGQPVIEQAASYMQTGHPKHWGLWATGIIVYRPDIRTKFFGTTWLAEQAAWTVQDQISQPFVLRQFDMRPTTIPGDIFAMKHATIRPHRDYL